MLHQSLRLPRDQFTSLRDDHHRYPRPIQLVLLAVAVLAGWIWWAVAPAPPASVGPVLTATAIFTGFTFSMAVVFWNKSIDARADPRFAMDGPSLRYIDEMRTHFVYTVAVGVLTTVVCMFYELFAPAGFPAKVLASVVTTLVSYLLLLVLIALKQFNESAVWLKRT